VTSAQRKPLFPEVPAIAESVYKGFEAQSWSGFSAITCRVRFKPGSDSVNGGTICF